MTKTYNPNSIITVFVEHHNNTIEPVSYELIGKAKQLALNTNMEIFAVLSIIPKKDNLSLKLLEHLVDHIDIYEYEKNSELNILDYRDSLKKHIIEHKPMIVLVGATPLGRSFAPRVAAYFKTGITADCTELSFNDEKGLIQIRPAYGGNVIAKIIAPESYPQMATIRPGVMELPQYKNETKSTTKTYKVNSLHNEIKVIRKQPIKKEHTNIENAETIILAGNAIKYDEDLELIKKLASSFDAEWATTRPLVEGGLADYSRQVGISGKTIRPKLIIAFGVSGTTQTLSGIAKAEKIIAINQDKNAPIFKNCDIGIISDWKVIAKDMLKKLNK
jgi:electron transfer flavoprotein alpha subunit